MAGQPACTCGQNEPARIIFPCAGQANTGQITNLAAIQLTEEGYGSIACVALLATGSEGLVAGAKHADEVVVIDGCPMQCAQKIAEAEGVPVAQHLVVTDLGIAKGPSRSYTDDDIETVVSAAWEGAGKTGPGEDQGPGITDGTPALTIEWRHIGGDVDTTCERCGETGTALHRVVEELRPVCAERGIALRVLETELPDERVAESNTILFNDVPLEDLIAGMEVTATPCASCACITGQDGVECRAVEVDGDRYEAIPAELIARAALKALDIETTAE
ncbi:MAG: putative zinc-binding protein [Methanomicrobiales archaeon]